MAMVNVVTIAAYRRIYWLRLIGLVQRSAATWRCVLHSSDEPGELSQWQCTAAMTAPYTLSWLLLLTFIITCKQFYYTVSQKSIPDIIDCNLKWDYQILIIFGTNIPDTTGHRTTVQVPTSPNVCFCTTWGKQNKRNMRWNKQKMYLCGYNRTVLCCVVCRAGSSVAAVRHSQTYRAICVVVSILVQYWYDDSCVDTIEPYCVVFRAGSGVAAVSADREWDAALRPADSVLHQLWGETLGLASDITTHTDSCVVAFIRSITFYHQSTAAAAQLIGCIQGF